MASPHEDDSPMVIDETYQQQMEEEESTDESADSEQDSKTTKAVSESEAVTAMLDMEEYRHEIYTFLKDSQVSPLLPEVCLPMVLLPKTVFVGKVPSEMELHDETE